MHGHYPSLSGVEKITLQDSTESSVWKILLLNYDQFLTTGKFLRIPMNHTALTGKSYQTNLTTS
jgi:hypothetical protein